jgi:hypothetical protein
MRVNLGGDRLGSGNKNDLELHNYYRSTHNLSQDFTSPMTVGPLYPFLVIPCMRNDKFEIELNADCITIPTEAPLFGSFKMQTDLFFCPARLYQAILHNNPTNIGLKMNQVMLPIRHMENRYNLNEMPKAFNNSCLYKYLGMSGIGRGTQDSERSKFVARDIMAIPELAYYDIFKNYYANKQEENAYVITGGTEQIEWVTEIASINDDSLIIGVITEMPTNSVIKFYWINGKEKYPTLQSKLSETAIMLYDEEKNELFDGKLSELLEKIKDGSARNVVIDETNENNYVTLSIINTNNTAIQIDTKDVKYISLENFDNIYITVKQTLKLNPFKLTNIDDMRMEILSHHTMGAPFRVDQFNKLPYIANSVNNNMEYPLNGLVVKTYQSDLFNNWVNTEWIDGENGIAEITKVATTDGAFKIDALNLAEKLYNMLNRVAVSGGTYEDWQNVVYDEAPRKQIESPIYLGGMSSEIVFQQITSTAASTNANGEFEPLGSLAGQGKHVKRKGGKVVCKCDEAGFIIGIVSITPRIKYHQGNEFYLTELKSLDDMHKPALDGIGFQNLLGERLAWWDTVLDGQGVVQSRSVVGKVPAWIEYMTAVDKTYGDFAEEDGKAYMVLNRNYEADTDGTIKDVTTYIDPTKYNYAFTYKALDAQNFWTEIYSHITARRKMSAKQIPNI